MQVDERQLNDLVSIGPAMLSDLELLGINSVAQLRFRNPKRMYQQLCRIKRQTVDPCCLDVFVAAAAQARDPNLPIEQRQWWYWSKVRKQQIKSDSNRRVIDERRIDSKATRTLIIATTQTG